MSQTDVSTNSPGTAYGYYILYYSVVAPDGARGPMKRERYVTVTEAMDRVREMRRGNQYSPIEIRDVADKLITCAQMGWKTSPLTANAGRAEQMKFRW